MHRRPVYIYLLNVPSFSSRYFNKIKRTSRLGRLLDLSLEILISLLFYFNLVLYTYKYIQVTERKRIRTKAGSLCYSSPMVNLQECMEPGRIELATAVSAVRHASVVRHVTDCATRPGTRAGLDETSHSLAPFWNQRCLL